MYLLQFTISRLPYFLPAIILAVIPNTKKALITALVLIAMIFTGPIIFSMGIGYYVAFITKPHILMVYSLVLIPTVLAKIFAIRAKNLGKDKLAMILPFLGLVGPILLVMSNDLINDTRRVYQKKQYTVSEECKSNGLKPIMSGVHFNLKPLDTFEFRQGTILVPRTRGYLCDKTDEGNNTFEAESITYRFPNKRLRKSGYCSDENEEWVSLVCHIDDDLPKNISYNSIIIIFKKGKSSSLHTGGLSRMNYDSTYQYYIDSKNEFNKVEGHEGFYKRKDLGEHIWISPDPSMKSPDGNPYATSCRGIEGVCVTTYLFNDEIVLRYSFASGNDMNMRTEHVDKVITQIVDEWRGINDNRE